MKGVILTAPDGTEIEIPEKEMGWHPVAAFKAFEDVPCTAADLGMACGLVPGERCEHGWSCRRMGEPKMLETFDTLPPVFLVNFKTGDAVGLDLVPFKLTEAQRSFYEAFKTVDVAVRLRMRRDGLHTVIDMDAWFKALLTLGDGFQCPLKGGACTCPNAKLCRTGDTRLPERCGRLDEGPWRRFAPEMIHSSEIGTWPAVGEVEPVEHVWSYGRCSVCGDQPCPVHEPVVHARSRRWTERE